MKKCLNIGCGDKPLPTTAEEEWVNLDIRPLPNIIIRDVRYGLPFSDSAFDHVLCDNILEHMTSEEAIRLINEIDRVLVSLGTLLVIVPHFGSQGAVQDPTHKSLWAPRTFLYLNQCQTPFGGRSIGITANLVAIEGPTISGDMDTEAFIRCMLRKEQIT